MSKVKEIKNNYVALHNHSHYSTLDGYATIDEYIKAAKENDMIGIGLADHGTASGLYKFITRTQEAGLIPVPGIEFYAAPENPKGAKAQEPIYYGKGGRRAPKYDVSNGAYTHITVFAYNNVGVSNLFKLTSISHQPEHFYFRPRIDTNMLAEYSEGLIVTTGCPSSEVSRRFLLGQDDKAYEYASRLKSIFGDNLYVEIMDHKMEDEELERILVPKQIKLAKDLDIKLIATNDSHYAFKEDAEPHERILAVATKTTMDEKPFHMGGRRFAFSTPEYYIKSYDEMKELYPKEVAEEALANTIELTNKCKDIKLEYDPHLRPEIDIPEGHSPATYLQELIYEGFKDKRGHQDEETQAESVRRIQEEFKVLHSNDFISYFLVVHDYIDYAHRNNIGVGAGRGSVGGSEIAYLLDISNTDPIRFDLLFERFLSPGRGSLYQIDYVSGESEEIPVSAKKRVYSDDGTAEVVYVHELYPGDLINHDGQKKVIEDVFVKIPGSAPDVDTDFHTEGREEVIQYCVDKYGEENVANIITFGTFKAKRAFKAMSTVYNVPFALANRASNFIPGTQGAEASLKELMDPTSPRYNEGADFRNTIENPAFDEVVEMATPLDGRISEEGVHPCGVIISNQPLAGIIPTQVRQRDKKIVTQWEYPELEALGLIKMDFLGLELIDTIQQTLENIKLTNESATSKNLVREVPDMRELIQGKMDDSKTYENLQEGNTVGIFQLGSPGVQDLLRRAKPTSFMDIATITALYRPGPMSVQAHNEWADRKNGVKDVVYLDEDLKGTVIEDILSDTAGILVFQEELMQIATQYAGMTPYESDALRKAMGKKNMSIMTSLKPKFIQGAIERGSTKELAEKVWGTMEGFGAYGFNKSHSVSYAINIYQTIYLKTHYPGEYMAALIQQGFGNPDRVRSFIQEAMRMKLRIGPVDVNESQVKMASAGIDPNRENDIVFGFSGVKQINDTLANAIVDERNENGQYKSVADFVKRVSQRTNLTAGPLSRLAIAGAFDSFGVSRKQVSEKAKMIIDSSSRKATQGVSLFDMMGGDPVGDVTEAIDVEGEEFDFNEMIKEEADAIGMFVSGHPTSRLGHIANMYSPEKLSSILSSGGSNKTFNVLGTVTQMSSKTNRSGNKSISILIDDGSGTATTYLPRGIVKSIEKGEEIIRLRRAKERGTKLKPTKRSESLMELIKDPEIKAVDPIELNEPYLFKVKTRGWGDTVNINVIDIKRLHTAPNGSLPYEVNVPSKEMVSQIEEVIRKHEDKSGTYVKANVFNGTKGFTEKLFNKRVELSVEFIIEMENIVGKANIVTNKNI